MSLGISQLSDTGEKLRVNFFYKLPEFNTVEIAKVVWYILNQVNFTCGDTTAS